MSIAFAMKRLFGHSSSHPGAELRINDTPTLSTRRGQLTTPDSHLLNYHSDADIDQMDILPDTFLEALSLFIVVANDQIME